MPSPWSPLPEPLVVNSPFTDTLLLPILVPPESLLYGIKQVSENFHRSDPGQEFTSWQVAIRDAGISLALETQQEITFSLEPGRYVLEVYATWAELGSVDYGFFIEVQAAADSNATAPTDASSTSSPPPTPTSSPVYTCEDTLRLTTDSPEAQQIVNEFVTNYKQHPT